jgi:integrase
VNNRGLGSVYRPSYVDKASGERKVSAVWWIRWHHRGKKYRESSESTNENDAKRLLKKRLGEAAIGRPVGPQVEKTTFEDLKTILLDEYRANGRRSINRIEDALNHLAGFFTETRAIDITTDRVTAYVAERQKEGAAAATINRELAALRRAFRLARRAKRVAEVPELSLLSENNVRTGFFEPDQIEAVLANLPDFLKPVIRTAYITGWRVPSEVLTRQRHHVDLDAGWLRLEPGETKNRDGRNFPLTPELREVIERQIEQTRAFELATGQIVPWLFHRNGKPIKDFRGAWTVACKAAGVPGRLVHDFRRTAVRNLERAGVPRSAAMKMTGHKTEAVYRRYAIVDEAMLQESAVKLSNLHQLQAEMARRPRKVVALKSEA